LSELQYPSTTGSERDLLNEYLDWYRLAILRKIEGASEETLRKRLVPSQTTLLGIVKHLAWVEIWWFQMVFAGRDIEDPYDEKDPDGEWRIEEGETAESIVAFYKEACAQSRTIAADAPSLDAESAKPGKKWNLRRILIHMIEETARHTGHADILRELLDGRTGD
jgi:uncharacterized damage-inducible protein DinB